MRVYYTIHDLVHDLVWNYQSFPASSFSCCRGNEQHHCPVSIESFLHQGSGRNSGLAVKKNAAGKAPGECGCMGNVQHLLVSCLSAQSHPVSNRLRPLSASDYIIKEKTVLLQKKDSEGFGFVLRGAKGEKCDMNILSCNDSRWLRHVVGAHAFSCFYCVSSSDSYRGVHPHPGLSRAAVPGVSGRGRRRLEGRPQDGRFSDRGTAMIYVWRYGLELKALAYFLLLIYTKATNILLCRITLHLLSHMLTHSLVLFLSSFLLCRHFLISDIFNKPCLWFIHLQLFPQQQVMCVWHVVNIRTYCNIKNQHCDQTGELTSLKQGYHWSSDGLAQKRGPFWQRGETEPAET